MGTTSEKHRKFKKSKKNSEKVVDSTEIDDQQESVMKKHKTKQKNVDNINTESLKKKKEEKPKANNEELLTEESEKQPKKGKKKKLKYAVEESTKEISDTTEIGQQLEMTKKRKKRKLKNVEMELSTETHEQAEDDKPQEKKKGKKSEEATKKGVSFTSDTIDNEVEASVPPKKGKKSEENSQLPTKEELEEINKPENVQNKDSIRSQKRKKYESLLANNKLKSELQTQQKSLNYLSRWKHNKNEWKFEKLRQIWIQNHMFDAASVPDEFWDTVLKYFGESKGHIRKVLIEDCTKIVEAENSGEDDVKYKRARELCQYLQE